MSNEARRNGRLFGLAGLVVAVGACVPGGAGAPSDPAAPENKALGRLCTTIYSLTGSFQPGAPDPDNLPGCWPVGTWTFTAAMGDNNCQTMPAVETQYAFKVDRDLDTQVDTYTYLNNPGDDHVRLKVNAGDGGICTGIMDVFTQDGMGVYSFRPALETNNVLDGFGEFDLYDTEQWKQ